MAQNLPDVSDSRFFATRGAPYIEYLRALGDGWEEVETIRRFLISSEEKLRELVAYRVERRILRHPRRDQTLAAIVDIRADNASNTNSMTVAAQISKSQIRGQREGMVELGPADDFFRALRHCVSNVHTRLVILQDSISSNMQDERAVEALFFAHVLGIELKLTPIYVCSLSQRRDVKQPSCMRRYQNPQFMDSHVKFQMSHGQSDNVGSYLGRSKIGDGMPHVGKSRT